MKQRITGILGAVLALAAASAGAQQPAWTVIHAGHAILDPQDGVRDRVSIVLKGEVIERVESGFVDAGTVGEPGSVQVVDLSDKFVLPGLIDAHVHLTMPYGGRKDRHMKTAAEHTIDGVVNARATLMAGYTLVRDAGDAFDGSASRALKEGINAGRITGPRMLIAGAPLSPTAGHADPPNDVKYVGDKQAPGVCDGADDCRRAVRWQVREGSDLIKLHATGGGSEEAGDKNYDPAFSDAEFEAIVAAAHAVRRKVAAHAHGYQGINAALRAGVDSVEHGSFLNKDSIKLFLQKGAYLVPTMAVLNDLQKRVADGMLGINNRNVQFIEEMPGNIAAAWKAGVKIASGSDAGITPHGENAKELARYVSIGMTPTQALLSSTHYAALLLDMDSKVGTLQRGKWADIIAVSSNPLLDITALQNVDFVMKGGIVYKHAGKN